MFSLFLAMILSGSTVERAAIDNVTFKTAAQCEQYKTAMHYADSASLKFTCEKTK